MVIVGIESTAHTFGIGIVNTGKIAANVRDMYTTKNGGIIPMESARHHERVSEDVYRRAIATAGIRENEIRAVAFSCGPGLAPCLLVGLRFARILSLRLRVPLVPVNHCIAHLEIGRSCGARDPVLLYASGANTQIIAFVEGMYRVFGETLDLGIGNCIDTFARTLGKGFPGGPIVEQLAKDGEYYLELPYTIKGMDISFSGLLSKAQQLYAKGEREEDICTSIQETAFAMLVEASERAMAHTGKIELVLGGGVGCNERLQEMCNLMCSGRKAQFFCPSKDLLVDNGAMIAFTGEFMFRKGIKKKEKEVDISPRERTDMVRVTWR